MITYVPNVMSFLVVSLYIELQPEELTHFRELSHLAFSYGRVDLAFPPVDETLPTLPCGGCDVTLASAVT